MEHKPAVISLTKQLMETTQRIENVHIYCNVCTIIFYLKSNGYRIKQF